MLIYVTDFFVNDVHILNKKNNTYLFKKNWYQMKLSMSHKLKK